MSATDELRRMLDERGADYRVSSTGYSIDIGPYTTAYANRSDTTLDVSLRQVTPEQAIAATLGDGTCLPHFWTHDGALHIELPKLPDSIQVRLPDQRDREAGSARVWQYTLGNDGVGRTNDGLADLQAENAKLRELAAKMARALGVNSEWCDRDCEREFGCGCEPCPLDQALRELGVEADDG